MFGVEVGAVDDGFGGTAGFFELEMFGLDGVFEGGEERFFELFEEEGEGAADNDSLGGLLVNDVEEAKGEASDEIFEVDVVEDEVLEGGDLVGLNEGFGGGKVFPFFSGAVKGIFDVTGLKSVGRFEEFAILGDAAADAGREGKVDGLAIFATGAGGFVESS